MMRSSRYPLLLLFLLTLHARLCGQQSPADPDHFVYRSWNNATGLPQNTVFALAQDKAGYLWGATEEGLFRFDGSEFSVINQASDPALPSSTFYDLCVDSTDLWASGRNNIIRISNKVEGSWDLSGKIVDGWIKCIEKDRSGRLWIGTSNGKLLYLYKDSVYQVKEWNAKEIGSIETMKFTTRGLCIGTNKGLFTLSGAILHPVFDERFQGIAITSIAPGLGTEIWIGTANRGLYNLSTDTFHITGTAQPFINALHFDKQNRLWIGYRSAGYQVLVNGVIRTPPQDAYAHDGIRTLLATDKDIIWMGTNSSGLVQMKPALISGAPASAGLDGKIILGIYQHANGETWVGTAGRGVQRVVNGKATTYDESNGLSSALVFSISGTGNFIYVGTANGLDRFNISTSRFDKHYTQADGLQNNSILCLYTDAENRTWISTRQGGLSRIEGDGIIHQIVLPASISQSNLISLFQDREGRIYAGSRSSGYLLIDLKDQIRVFHHDEGFDPDIVYSFFQDADGDLWTGTEKGLLVLKKGKYKLFDKSSGLRFNEIYRIMPDQSGHLWMSGNAGLQRVSLTDLVNAKNAQTVPGKISARLFNSFDGMPNSETNGGFFPAGWPMMDNTLWFPTGAGVAVVDHNRIVEEQGQLDIHVQSLRYGNEEFFPAADAESKLPAGVYNFEIRYTSIDFSKAPDIRYFYRLKGLSDEWIAAGNRHIAYFSALNPGNYVFEVKAERYGSWSPIGSMGFTLRPHFYQATWFRLLMILLVLVVIAGFIRASRLAVKHRVLEQQRITRAQIEGQEKERQFISRELHDNVNQQLTTAKLYLDFARTNDEMRSELMLKSETVIHRVINDIRKLCNSLTPPSLKDIGLKESLQDLVHSYRAAGKFKIHWLFDLDPDELEEELQFTLFRITQEQIQNISKHSNASNVWIEFTKEEESLLISIQDDGIGFDMKHQKYGMGFENIRNRLLLYNGRMELKSTPGTGCLVLVTIPVRKSNR